MKGTRVVGLSRVAPFPSYEKVVVGLVGGDDGEVEECDKFLALGSLLTIGFVTKGFVTMGVEYWELDGVSRIVPQVLISLSISLKMEVVFGKVAKLHPSICTCMPDIYTLYSYCTLSLFYLYHSTQRKEH